MFISITKEFTPFLSRQFVNIKCKHKNNFKKFIWKFLIKFLNKWEILTELHKILQIFQHLKRSSKKNLSPKSSEKFSEVSNAIMLYLWHIYRIFIAFIKTRFNEISSFFKEVWYVWGL